MTELNKLPNDWQWVKLNDAGKIVSGGTPSTTISEYWNGNISWISPSDLSGYKNKTIKKGAKSITEIGLKNSSTRLMPKGSVLFSSRAPIGYVVIADNELCTNQGFKSIIPNENIDSNFLYYYLKASKQRAEQVASGTTFKEISLKSFSELSFPLPPLSTQQAIVAKIEELFSELDKGIDNLKTAQQQLKTYRQAVLKYAFEGKLTEQWRSLTKELSSANDLLKYIEYGKNQFYENQIKEWEIELKLWESKKNDGKKPPKPKALTSVEKPNPQHEERKWDIPEKWIWTQLGVICFVTKLAGFEYTDYVKYIEHGDLPVLKAENVGTSGFKKTDFSKVDSQSIKMLKRSQLFGGELLIVFVGAGTGNVAMVPLNQKYFLGPNIGMARPYLEVNSKYVELFYRSEMGKNLMMAAVKAVAQPSLSMETIRQAPIAFPSMSEQNKIVEEIESRLSIADKMEESIIQSLQQAEALRQSILKKAFSGELVG